MRNWCMGIMKWPQQRPHMSKRALGYDAMSSTPTNPCSFRKSTINTSCRPDGGGGDSDGLN